MNRSRAVLAAVAAAWALTFAATAPQASPPLSSSLDYKPIIAEAVATTVSIREGGTLVPGSVSSAFLGIGISGLITFRRFRKLFN